MCHAEIVATAVCWLVLQLCLKVAHENIADRLAEFFLMCCCCPMRGKRDEESGGVVPSGLMRVDCICWWS